MKLVLDHYLSRNFCSDARTESEELTTNSNFDSSSEESDLIAYLKGMFSHDEIDPGDSLLQFNSSKRDVLHMIVGMTNVEPMSESNRCDLRSSDIRTLTDTVQHGGECVH